MKIISTFTDGIETDLTITPTTPDDEKKKKEEIQATLSTELKEMLLYDNLVCLTGLGTSMGLTDSAGVKLAPSMPDLWNVAKTIPGTDFNNILTKINYDIVIQKENFESLMSQCLISEKFRTDPDVIDYKNKLEEQIVQKCSFVNNTTDLTFHIELLRKLVKRSVNKPRFKLFTTNYDLCFDEAALKLNFIALDGFSFSIPRIFDPTNFKYDIVKRNESKDKVELIQNVFNYFKLHGSLMWEKKDNDIYKKEIVPKPLIIYPRENKYEISFEQPFLELMSRFQNSIKEENTAFFVTGFGFNDDHLSQPIISALSTNLNFKLVYATWNVNYTNPYVKKLHESIKNGDNRIIILDCNFNDFVKAIPNINKTTQEEFYMDLIKKSLKS